MRGKGCLIGLFSGLLSLCGALGAQPLAPPDLWVTAYGITSADEVSQFKACGMTVGWISVRARTDLDVSTSLGLADAFEREGLPYLLALDLRPPPSLVGPSFLVCSPYNPAYVQWINACLQKLIPTFRDRKGLIAYALGESPDEALSYDDGGFPSFLQSRYRTIENLSNLWGFPLTDWTVTQQIAESADDRSSQIRFGRPSLDAAAYRYALLTELLALWARLVRKYDPNPSRLFIAGPLTTYRSLAAVPDDYSIALPLLSPERAEWDLQTHNCHSVAIARRAGRRLALAGLSTRWSDGSPVSPTVLANWMGAAIGQGACGFFFFDWSSLIEDPTLKGLVTSTVTAWKKEIGGPLVPRSPCAILYTPFSEGPVGRDGVPLYGFAVSPDRSEAIPRRLGLTEPAGLFSGLRFHPWGTTDCLRVEDLARIPLNRYSVLFAPMAVDLPPEAQQILSQFVASGGILVADFGAGAFQAEDPFLSLPPSLQSLLGIVSLRRVLFDENLRVNMVVLSPHPLFPQIPEGAELGQPLGAFPYIVGLTPSFTADPWAVLSTARFAKKGRKAGRLEIAAVFINRYGRGYALFAPTLLWAIWMPGQPGFEYFHGSLITRRSRISLQSLQMPPPVWITESEQGIFLFNPDDQSRQVTVLSLSSPYWVYNNSATTPAAGDGWAQAVTASVNGHDWLYLRRMAIVDPPVPVSVKADEKVLILHLQPTQPTTVSVRVFPGPYPATDLQHTMKVIADGKEKDQQIVSSESGVLRLPPVRAPSTVILQPISQKDQNTNGQ